MEDYIRLFALLPDGTKVMFGRFPVGGGNLYVRIVGEEYAFCLGRY